MFAIAFSYILVTYLVRMKGLEPSRPKTLEPKSSASTNSATSANFATSLMIAGI